MPPPPANGSKPHRLRLTPGRCRSSGARPPLLMLCDAGYTDAA